MRIEMRSTRKITISVVASLVLSLLTQLTLMQSAHACSAPPEQSRLKVVWGATGGPSFEIKPSKTGSLPTTIQYTYSFLKAGDSKYGEWADWVSTNISSVDTLITLKAPSSSTNEFISVSAYASNACGNAIYTMSFRLLTYETLKPVTSETLKMAELNMAKDLPLSQARIPKRYFYPNNIDIPQTLSTKSSSVCTYDEKTEELLLLSAGNCEITISQNNEKMSTPNPDMTYTINILPNPSILPGVKKDRPDDIKGFQVHFIYVTLKNKSSSNFLESGLIQNWLDLANAWLKRKIGKEFIFDTYQGAHDVSILESRYTEQELMLTSDNGALKSKDSPLQLLRAEFALQNGSQMLGKNMFFIIDGKLSKNYCGLANQPGNTGLSTPGSDLCWDPESGFIASTSRFSSPSSTIAHELIHNLGVGHPCENPSDVMYGTGCDLEKMGGEEVIDINNSLYVGASKAGANILDLKVWKDGSGKRYIPIDGVCYVGEPCLVSNGYWNSPQGDLIIQERIGGKWKDLQSFKVKKIGSNKYAFNASIIPREKGIHTYREYIAPTKKFSAYAGKAFMRNVVY
jgi:hypothetical protein